MFLSGRPRHPKADAYKWFPETSEGGCFISGRPEAFPECSRPGASVSLTAVGSAAFLRTTSTRKSRHVSAVRPHGRMPPLYPGKPSERAQSQGLAATPVRAFRVQQSLYKATCATPCKASGFVPNKSFIRKNLHKALYAAPCKASCAKNLHSFVCKNHAQSSVCSPSTKLREPQYAKQKLFLAYYSMVL